METNKENKFKQWLNQSYQDIIALATILMITTGLLMYFLHIQSIDFSIPFSYSGGDDMSSYVETKMMSVSGSNTYTDLLGGNQGLDKSADIITGLHNADLITAKVGLLLTGNDYVKANNLVYITAFYFIALVAYYVLRQMKIRPGIAVVGAEVFAFLPFIFMRGIGHLVLACYYFTPLSILLCQWIYEDERFLRFDRDFFRYKRNILAILFAFAIANSGIGYWQFFACFFLAVAGFVNVIRTKKFRYVKQAIVCVAMIIGFMVLGCIPEIITILQGGVGARGRSVVDSEIYSLKLIQLVLPIRGHGIDALQNTIDSYNMEVPTVTENATSYIGFMGIAGLLILLVVLFLKNKKQVTESFQRLSMLAELNICAILLCTMGGFGAMIYLAGFTMARAYTRVSVFIGFFCIAAVCLLLNQLFNKFKKLPVKIIAYVVMGLMTFGIICEQNPRTDFPMEQNTVAWNSDAAFISQIESTVDKDAYIFQLPYAEYPEGVVQNNMYHMAHFIGYMHSDTLHWSFGMISNSEPDLWYYELASTPADNIVKEAKKAGYAGIYINRSGYEETEWRQLEADLAECIGKNPIVSDNEILSFFPF